MKRLSIIVPAYNEEKRIPQFLKSLLEYSRSYLKSYEIIIVDDGSKDRTSSVVSGIISNDRNARIISYRDNRGKGYAVRKGVLNSKGKYVLFIDADGSIAPNEIPNMMEKLEKGYDAVVGTRGISKSKVIADPLRKFIGVIFNVYVNMLFWIRIEDNLCGFKGFKRDAAIKLFRNLIARRWIFDVEIFYRIRKSRMSLYQMPIKWVHKEGTKISVMDPFIMAYRLIILRLRLLIEK